MLIRCAYKHIRKLILCCQVFLKCINDNIGIKNKGNVWNYVLYNHVFGLGARDYFFQENVGMILLD